MVGAGAATVAKMHVAAITPEVEAQANAHLIVAAPELLTELKREVLVLEDMADLCDAWANESKDGGWSTHQVKAHREAANECRRRASDVCAAIAKADPA